MESQARPTRTTGAYYLPFLADNDGEAARTLVALLSWVQREGSALFVDSQGEAETQSQGWQQNSLFGEAATDTPNEGEQLTTTRRLHRGLDPRVTQCPLKGVQDLQVPAMRPAQPLLSRLQPHRGSGTCDKRWRRYKFCPVLKGTRTRSQR